MRLVTSPDGRSGGNSEASPWARQPAVTTVSPRWTSLLESMKSRISSSGLPTSGLTMPCTPCGTTLAETALEWSVIRVTWAEPPCHRGTRPTSPSPSTTGSSTATPSPLPTSIVTVEYQTVGERAITRPVTGL